MAEYIEREALYEKAYWHGEHPNVDNPFPDGVDAIDIKDVDAIPAADVAPVRHARWVDNHCTACGMMPMGDEMWKLCDFEPPRFERFMDYCPSCGCRMDG